MAETTTLSTKDAASLVDGIRSSFEKAWANYADGCEQLVQAYQGRAWEALNLSCWAEFVTHTLDVDHLKIPKTERLSIVASLRDGGLSVREIAAATGLGVGTVHRSLTPLTVPNGTPEVETPGTFEYAMANYLKAAEQMMGYVDQIAYEHPGETLRVLREMIELTLSAQNICAERVLRAEREAGRMLAGVA